MSNRGFFRVINGLSVDKTIPYDDEDIFPDFISCNDICEIIIVNDIYFLLTNLSITRLQVFRQLFESSINGDLYGCDCDMKKHHIHNYMNFPSSAICLCKLTCFPLYMAINKKRTKRHIIHPDEKEHVERFLAGTDDPLYDFIHELRYNPKFMLGNDVEEAKNEFTKKRKFEKE
jgi:hypothetical protein